MKYQGFGIFLFIILYSTLIAADPFLTVSFETFEVTKLIDNPYISSLSGHVVKKPRQNAVSGECDIIDFPEGIQATIKMTMNGIPLPAVSGSICHLLGTNPTVKSVAATVEPKNQLDKGCPIQPGKYRLNEFEVDTKAIPLGLVPDCKFTLLASLHMPGEESVAEFKMSGVASHFK